jgi:hypothetical protein
MPTHNGPTIERRHERYLIGIIESDEATKREKAEASRQLTRLRELRAQRQIEQKAKTRPVSNVLGALSG